MKKILLCGAALIAAGALFAFLTQEKDEGFSSDSSESKNSPLRPSLEAYRDAARLETQERSRSALSRLSNVKVQTRLSTELFETDSRLIALSADELEWMVRHHYPTREELNAIDGVKIEATLGTPDPRQETLRGLALIKRGNIIGGVSVLTSAGAQGSIYAYEEAALAEHALNEERLGKSVDTDTGLRARMEVAKILGDYRAEDLVKTHLPDYDDRAQAHALQLQTTEYLRKLGEDVQLRNLAPTGPDPRPNADAWNDLRTLHAAGQSTEIETFTFGR